MTVHLWQQSASDLAKAISTRQVSSLDVVTAHLDRIAAINSGLNAVIADLSASALTAAQQADEQLAKSDAVGPLHGVPFTIKDVFDFAGTPTTMGIVDLKETMPTHDTHIVACFKRAGAIPIGRTNVPDFGLRWHTDNELFGATLNPWDKTRTPGGSSGGEAVAIATGMSPLGIGGDMGGSLRYPAQCCGIAALKPGFGRVSRTITSIFDSAPMFYEQNACVNGPMARHVKDLRLALEVMSSPDPNDPCWMPPPQRGAGPAATTRVAVTIDPGGYGCCPIVAETVMKAADTLSDAGYAVEAVDPPCLDETTGIIQQIADAEMQGYMPGMLPMMSQEAGSYLETLIEDTVIDLPTYTNAIARRHAIAAQWRAFMQDHPLILGPVSTMQPFKVGYDLVGKAQLQRLIQSLTLTEACNLLGLPSIAVPVLVAEGLPQGVQVIGPRFQEELCLDAAEQIEQKADVPAPIEPCFSD